jgi:hypothetical protein
MITLNDITRVKLSRKSFEFDSHTAYSVTDRETGRLIGHVGKTRSKIYGRKHGKWCYLGVTEPRESAWTLAGWTRTDAVDHLMSHDHPQGKLLA